MNDGSDAFEIDPEIGRAKTPPARIYRDVAAFDRQREGVFSRCWHLIPGAERVRAPGHVLPFTLLEGCLDEPLVLSRGDDGRLRCLSNVCTHRGALVVEGEGHLRGLRCRYHGRRFGLDGAFVSMPEFDGVECFPDSSDDLPGIALEHWSQFAFCSLDPAFGFQEWIEPVIARTSFLPIAEAVFDPASSRDYLVRANWALYCDNYLEEFHIPYVHGASLSDKLDYATYRTELYEWGNLQLGTTRTRKEAFDLPAGHPDAGELIAAFYFWLFPNLMLNFYPWGLSVNIVQPIAVDRTRVSFLSYVWDERRRGEGAGGDLHRVEMEDEEIIESVQAGVRSRLYDRGRYSPRREVGTHHFHGLLARFAGGAAPEGTPASDPDTGRPGRNI
jgi:choline monooxygenase